HNDILTIDNTSQTVSFIGEVNTSDLTRPQFKPFIDTSSNQSYLTKDYAAYKAAKNQSELIRPSTRVFEVRLTSSIVNSSLHGMQQDNNSRGVHSTTNHSENFVIDNNRRHYDGPQSATATTQMKSGSIGSLTGFEGLSQNCCSPPDVQVAAAGEGPSNYIVEMVNLDGAIYTKSGNLIKAFGLNQFFNPSDNSFSKSNDDLTDPLLLFDYSSGRWFASISDTTTQSIRIAVSKTNDPTGVWRVYDFPIESSQPDNCSDQPFIGVSKDKFVIAVDNWANNCNWYSGNRPPEFRGAQLTIADKSDLVNGSNSIRCIQSESDLNYFSLHPVSSISPTSEELLIVSVGNFNYNKIQLFYIDGPISNLHIRVATSDLIQTTHVPPDGIQPHAITRNSIANDDQQCCNNSNSNSNSSNSGTEHIIKEPKVSTGDAAIQSATWYQGKLWIALNDGCFPNGDIKSRSCIRFIQLDTTTNSNNNTRVIQDFDVAAVGSSLYYPALSIDRAGNLGVIFGYSSQSVYPSLLVSMRLVKDISNTIEQPQVLKLGRENELSNRYGDYFGAFTDPSSSKDYGTVWVAGQYHTQNTWSTYIGRLHMH
ncbi:MAG TPA: hypothetical protein VFJ51_14035, partial [Nitrososphaeraceae archaeon]|nr:hypothetical protein [Nitrososphaeraceae archaeon]